MPNIFKDEYELAIEKGCYIERDCYSKLLDWKNRKARNHNALFIFILKNIRHNITTTSILYYFYHENAIYKLSFTTKMQ